MAKPRGNVSYPRAGVQVDSSDPLGQGLMGCWLFDQIAGDTPSLVHPADNMSLSGTATYNATSQDAGMGALYTPTGGTGSGATLNTPSSLIIPEEARYTVMWRGVLLGNTDAGSTSPSLFSLSYDSAGSIAPFLVFGIVRNSGTFQDEILGYWNDGVNLQSTGSMAFGMTAKYGIPVQFTLVVGPVGAFFYYNGLQVFTGGPANAAPIYSGGGYDAGGYCRAANANTTNSFTTQCRFYNRILTQTEITTLWRSPYRGLTTARRAAYRLGGSFPQDSVPQLGRPSAPIRHKRSQRIIVQRRIQGM